MNEFEIRDKLISEREEIKSFEDLVAFLKEVREYNSDYGGAPRAIAQAALATAQCSLMISVLQNFKPVA